TELQTELLGEAEGLVDREIPLLEAGAAERVTAHVSKRSAGRRSSERVASEVVVDAGRRALAGRAPRNIRAKKCFAAIIVRQASHVIGGGRRVEHVQRRSGIRD